MNVENKKGMINKAWKLQYRIEKRIRKIKPLSNEEYFFFLTFIFFITGILMFVYSIMFGVNIVDLHLYSSPLFYLLIGFCCLIGKSLFKDD